MAKSLPAVWETRVQSLGQEDPLEKEMATHSSILAWKIPWMEKPDRLQSMRSARVVHDWATSLSFFFFFFFFLFVVNSVILLSSSKLALWCYWECQRSNAYTDAGTKTDGLLKAPSKATETTYSINVYILLKLFVKNSKFWVLPLSLYTDWMLLSSVDFEATESWFSSPSILSHSCFLVWFMVQHLASQHG